MVRGRLTVSYSEVVVSRQMQIGAFGGCERIVNAHVFSPAQVLKKCLTGFVYIVKVCTCKFGQCFT